MLLPVLSLLLVPAAPQEAEPLRIPSRPERVTVYGGQALVERSYAVEAAAPGPLVVEIGPLPLGLDTSSFQTKVVSGQAVIQGVETREVSGDALDHGERDRLRARLADLQAERRDLGADEASILAGQEIVRALIGSLASPQGGAGVLAAAVDGASLEALFRFVRERSAALDRELSAFETARDRLDQMIDEVRDQLGGEAGAPLRRYQLGRVQIWAEAPGRIELRSLYLVAGASWQPTYDVRVAPDLTGVTVALVGEVRQRTGEDWQDAELVLSTSRPSVGLDPPAVPLRVFEPAVPVFPFAAAAPAAEKAGDAATAAGGADRGKLGFAFQPAPEVVVQDLGLSALFQLPDRKTVRADGEPYRFRLREVPLEVRPERYLVPTRSPLAYLRAEVRLAGDTPLLPGTAKIFLGPDYLGQSSFPVLRPGDQTTLNLGVDPNLSVEWDVVKDERDDPGMFSSTATITRVYRARLKLSAAALGPVDVVVEESIPIVRGAGVEVQPVEMRPNPLRGEVDLHDQQERGLYRWQFRLAPGQGQNVYWGYEVDFDEDAEPVLIER